jgi:dTDP-4-amino-4,6-dideoxygalactose transaminase
MEKYAQQLDNDEDIEIPEEDQGKEKRKNKPLPTLIDKEDEEESTDDDEIIEKLLNEYKKIKAQYESRKIHFRRK